MKATLTKLHTLLGITALAAIAIPAHAGFFGPFNPVPEPSTLALMGVGLGAAVLLHKRNKRK